MPMRRDCKHYESRTYRTGETVQKCDLDLAPEAPWRCPEECPAYERKVVDAGWEYGSLVPPSGDDEDVLQGTQGVAELLDAAENIVNSVGPEVLAAVEEEQRQRAREERSMWRRIRRRFGR